MDRQMKDVCLRCVCAYSKYAHEGVEVDVNGDIILKSHTMYRYKRRYRWDVWTTVGIGTYTNIDTYTGVNSKQLVQRFVLVYLFWIMLPSWSGSNPCKLLRFPVEASPFTLYSQGSNSCRFAQHFHVFCAFKPQISHSAWYLPQLQQFSYLSFLIAVP